MLTTTETEFIRHNYQSLGGTDCANRLNRSRCAVVKYAKQFGLSLTHENRSNIMKRKLDKPFNKRNVDPTAFIMPEQMTSVKVYLLGFIWADGHVSFRNGACHISARFVTDDANDILPLFKKSGKWGIYTDVPPGGREATIVQTNNRPFAEFLDKMDYITKSSAPASKILDFIPTQLQRYWWLGCMDGDGCFYKGKLGQEIGIHSSYEQNWEHFEKMAKQVGIEYHKDRRIAKKGKSSAIRVVKKESCSKFIHYLYPNGYEFGLKRKYEKAIEILERCESTHIICPHCSNDIYIHKKGKTEADL